jgi:hypothetical protein
MDADWTVTIQQNATVQIQHRHAPVVRATHMFWAQNAKWVGASFRTGPAHDGQAILTGEVPGLGLKASGAIRPQAENALRVEYRFSATQGHPNIYGGVLDWRIELKSESFDRQAPDPILLKDQTGWMWPVGPNQAVVVRFDAPLDKVIFERNQKNNIRTFFYADRITPGPRRISYTVELPEAGRVAPTDEERYGPTQTSAWFRDALTWDGSPVDLSFLNAGDRPAGRHGFLRADGDHVVFEDGTGARFWGSNLAAGALFNTPRENVPHQARRMAKLGFNLMRIVHIDAPWCRPNIFDRDRGNTRHLNPKALDSLDWWIKCMKDEGIYVWLEFVYLRTLTPGDGVTIGFDEIQRYNSRVFGFNYYNRDVAALMREFQHQFLNHVNSYTRLAYKADPAVVAVLITNENDLTHHFGNLMLPDKNTPTHNALFMEEVRAFARDTGLPVQQLWRTWEPGPSKIFLNAMEHRFNQVMIEDLRGLGLRAPIVTTSFWGACPLSNLPALTDGDLIDVHSYGSNGELDQNPRYEANFVSWLAARVQGKPLSITEWNVPYPETDRFTAPLYVASIAALQGWSLPMHYNYSQATLSAPGKQEWLRRIDKWSSYNDPALCGVMPAAAVAFRRGHISPARATYCLKLDPAQLFGQDLSPATSATVRTLVEQSRLSVGLPAVKELPWLVPSETPRDVTIITDPRRDLIPAGQSFVRSDTGELTRDWKTGILTIDAPKTQAVMGWIGGKTLKLGAATFRFSTPKAVVALTSLEDRPLSASRFVLITALARAVPSSTDPADHVPFLSEPVVGEIILKTDVSDLQLLSLGPRVNVLDRLTPRRGPDGLVIRLPAGHGTHWYLLRRPEAVKDAVPAGQSSGTASQSRP